MTSSIPFNIQPFVENERSVKYTWLAYGLGLVVIALYGLIFHWGQKFIRRQRSVDKLSWPSYFKFMKYWDILNSSLGLRVPGTKKVFYIQPSLFILWAAYLAVNGALMVAETVDIDYEPHSYIVGKRVGRVAAGNIPLMYLFVLKNDLVGFVSGLPHDKANLVHRYMGRSIWVMVLIHLIIIIKYWLDLKFLIMLKIPPTIFGMIAFGCMTVLTWAGAKWIRNLSYEFFLFNHGFCAGVLMLMCFFHSKGSRIPAIIAVHTIVIDRVVAFIRAAIHKRVSSTKCKATAKILTEDTVELNIPLETREMLKAPMKYFPALGSWCPGQHVYLRIAKVRRVQWHPFTIASISESNVVRLVIRSRTGFTRGLYRTILKADSNESGEFEVPVLIHGPYGGHFQPPIPYDSTLFIAGGTGASFTLPVALDLLRTIRSRNLNGDYLHRPTLPRIRIVWYLTNRANLIWYESILHEILQYQSEAVLSVECYVTRASGSESAFDISYTELPSATKSNIVVEKQLDSGSSDSSSNSDDVESIEKIEISQVHSASASGKSSIGEPRMTIEDGKPDIAEIIRHEVHQLKSSQSIAMLSCGPESLTNAVRSESQKCRLLKKVPDIYSYIEKYVV